MSHIFVPIKLCQCHLFSHVLQSHQIIAICADATFVTMHSIQVNQRCTKYSFFFLCVNCNAFHACNTSVPQETKSGQLKIITDMVEQCAPKMSYDHFSPEAVPDEDAELPYIIYVCVLMTQMYLLLHCPQSLYNSTSTEIP